MTFYCCGDNDHGDPRDDEEDGHRDPDGGHLVQHRRGVGRILHRREERRHGDDLAMVDVLYRKEEATPERHLDKPVELGEERVAALLDRAHLAGAGGDERTSQRN